MFGEFSAVGEWLTQRAVRHCAPRGLLKGLVLMGSQHWTDVSTPEE